MLDPELKPSNRKYTAVRPSDLGATSSISLSEFLAPYEEFSKAYKDVRAGKVTRIGTVQAYLIKFLDIPDLFYVSFAVGRDLARGLALMDLRTRHPRFINNGWIDEFKQCRRTRIPQFDKYASLGRIPILELMSAGYKMPCHFCGKGNYGYEDFEDRNCYVYEDEGNMDKFAYGYAVCPSCHYKLNNQTSS